ncbi:hypothetical protein TWF730_002045 [Orbilia blumenaviensis]|uniref:Uncharacterized protein n=1 Tax=Orbilia blumenaviensis TaxID=1796055 RepID=A0AAV9UDN1_9PEZI
MISLALHTIWLAILSTRASGLIIDVIQTIPGTTDPPKLRLCRPLVGQSPVTVDPLKTACPDGSSAFWLWNYNSQPSDQMQTLINLLGVASGSQEIPYLLSQVDYNTVFSYGFTNPGLRYQPSVFKVKRNGEYQAIDSNNRLQNDDEFEYFSPVTDPAADKALRIQVQGKTPQYLMRQLTDGTGKAIDASSTYPTVTLKINSLGNTELVLPKGNWLQRGAQGLLNAANTIKSGFNAYVAQPLANTGTYITQNSPQWQETAKTWLGKTGNGLYNQAGALINNGVNYLSQPLANAGQWVETKLVNGIDQAGNVLNNAVDYVAAPLVAGGEWVENAANNYITQPIAQTGAWIGNTAANAYNTAVQDLTGVGPALGQGWQTVKDTAGDWARGTINNGLQRVDRWVNGVPVLQSVGTMGQVLGAVPSYIPASPLQTGAPSVGQVNSNALPIVAPQDVGGGNVLMSNGIPATLRTGGQYVAGNAPWGLSASQYYVPGQAKA